MIDNKLWSGFRAHNCKQYETPKKGSMKSVYCVYVVSRSKLCNRRAFIVRLIIGHVMWPWAYTPPSGLNVFEADVIQGHPLLYGQSCIKVRASTAVGAVPGGGSSAFAVYVDLAHRWASP